MSRVQVTSLICLSLAINLSAFSIRPADGQVSDAQIEAAKQKGLAFLKSRLPETNAESAPMVAYTLVKTGTPKNDPFIVSMVRFVKSRVNSSGEYDPGVHHFYTAGTSAMFLDAMGGENYERELKAISNYIVERQLSSGSWYYPNQEGTGDTSITQYSLLGLWAARRAGIEVPKSVWDRAARWLSATQLPNGAFIYHPGQNHGGNIPPPESGCRRWLELDAVHATAFSGRTR